MNPFRTMKGRLIRRATAPTAAAFESLASELADKFEPSAVFARDDIIELLQGVARRIRTGDNS